MDATTWSSQFQTCPLQLWPLGHDTRKTIVERIKKNLSSKSIFTQRYGCLSEEDAEENAKRIEDVAFATAHQHYENELDGVGGYAMQLYAKECSKFVLKALKRAAPGVKHDRELTSEEEECGKLLLEALKRGPEVKDDRELTSEKVMVFDVSKDQRRFIEAEEAGDILRPLKEPNNYYTKVCLGNKSFGLGAARVAEPILISLKNQLKEVDLSGFVAGRAKAEALKVMKIFSLALAGSVLKSLNLSNNALGVEGVRAFKALLKSQSCLEELYLMNDGISTEAAQVVCDLMPSTEKLRVLQFHNDLIGDEGALAISEVVKNSPLLEDFRCSSARIGSEGGIALSEALETCSHLKKLDLRNNMFGVEGGVALSRTLSKHADLTEVYLSHLNLKDEGAIAIANALMESAPSLQVLEMAGNDITAKAAPIVAACISAKQHLTKLNLAENEVKVLFLIGKALEKGYEQSEEVNYEPYPSVNMIQ